MPQVKSGELQTVAGTNGHDLHCTRTEISEMNENIRQLQADVEGLKDLRASPEAVITDAEHRDGSRMPMPSWPNWSPALSQAGPGRAAVPVPGVHEHQAGPGHQDRHLLQAAGR